MQRKRKQRKSEIFEALSSMDDAPAASEEKKQAEAVEQAPMSLVEKDKIEDQKAKTSEPKVVVQRPNLKKKVVPRATTKPKATAKPKAAAKPKETAKPKAVLKPKTVEKPKPKKAAEVAKPKKVEAAAQPHSLV